MRTQDEIVKRIDGRKDEDMFGFEINEYLVALDYEHAKPFLKEDVSKDSWHQDWKQSNPETLYNRMKDYMDFAWSKANDCRGISATRSLQHYIAWIWLYGDTEFANRIDIDFKCHYQYYGKPQLRWICENYNWEWRKQDGGYWQNSETGDGISAERAKTEMRRLREDYEVCRNLLRK